jgi:hypothetical protein
MNKISSKDYCRWAVIWAAFLWAVVSCTPALLDSNTVATVTPVAVEPTLEPTQAASPTLTAPSPSPEPLVTPTIHSTPTAIVTRPPEGTAVPTAIPIAGSLVAHDQQQVVLISLPSGEIKPLPLQIGPDELTWRLTVSPNGQQLVYWLKRETGSELWITSIEPWSPELLMNLPDSDYEGAGFRWISTGRYLNFSLWRTHETLLTYNRQISHLIDVEEKEVVATLPPLEELCPYLAFSSRTDRLATWCRDGVDSSDYLVVEISGELWRTSEAPGEVIKENKDYGVSEWFWSTNGQYVVYYGPVWGNIYLTPTDEHAPIDLSGAYGGVDLSPNGRYVTYSGQCSPDGTRCQLVVNVETKQITWRSRSIAGLADVHGLRPVWSPDGRHLATSGFGNIYIVDLESGEVVRHLGDTRFTLLAWIDD